MISITFTPSLRAQDLKLIDAEAVFRERFNIPTAAFRRKESCLPFTTGGGMQAAKVPCLFFDVVRNIKVQKIKSVDLALLNQETLDSLPTYREEKSFDITNCVSEPYHFDRTLRYTTHEGTSITYTQNYTNVQQLTGSWDLNVSLFNSAVGGKAGGSQTLTTTYSIGQTETLQKETTLNLESPEKFDVPPMKIYTISYSDTKKKAHIPIIITAVFSAEEYEEIRAIAGNVAQSTLKRTLNEPETEGLRTFQVKGDVLLQGSDETISIKRTEKPCS